MIEQYLLNTNEIARVLILPNILELNIKKLFGSLVKGAAQGSRSAAPPTRTKHFRINKNGLV